MQSGLCVSTGTVCVELCVCRQMHEHRCCLSVCVRLYLGTGLVCVCVREEGLACVARGELWRRAVSGQPLCVWL